MHNKQNITIALLAVAVAVLAVLYGRGTRNTDVVEKNTVWETTTWTPNG